MDRVEHDLSAEQWTARLDERALLPHHLDIKAALALRFAAADAAPQMAVRRRSPGERQEA